MTPLILIALLLATVRDDFPPVVHAIEINTTLDEKNEPRFKQIIAWDDRHRVRQWWMLADDASIYRVGDFYVVSQVDQNRQLRWMKTQRLRASATRFDPEELNRQRCPIDRRWPVFQQEK